MIRRIKLQRFLLLCILSFSFHTILVGDCPHCYKVAKVKLIYSTGEERVGYTGIYGSMYLDPQDHELLIEGADIIKILNLSTTISFAKTIYFFPDIGRFFMSEEINEIDISSLSKLSFIQWEKIYGAIRLSRLSRDNIKRLEKNKIYCIEEIDFGTSTRKFISLNPDIPDWELKLFVNNFIIGPSDGLGTFGRVLNNYAQIIKDSLQIRTPSADLNKNISNKSINRRDQKRVKRSRKFDRRLSKEYIFNQLEYLKITANNACQTLTTDYNNSIWVEEFQVLENFYEQRLQLYSSIEDYIKKNNIESLNTLLKANNVDLRVDNTNDINARMIKCAEIIKALYLYYKWTWDKKYIYYKSMLPNWGIIEIGFSYD